MPQARSLIRTRMKLEFFDAKKVVREVNRARRKALFGAAAYIRRVARTSMKRAKRKSVGPLKRDSRGKFLAGRKVRVGSKPGNPPHTREGSVRNLLKFAHDSAAGSMVIGPEYAPKASNRQTRTTIPNVLEFGGVVRPPRAKRKPGQRRTRRRRAVRIARRPFMRPALEYTARRGVLARQFKSAVKG